jgi:hypothetical protein
VNPKQTNKSRESFARVERRQNRPNSAFAVLILGAAIISGCAGPQGPPGPQGPAGPAGLARAYARWALGTGLVASQTRNFTAVSSP